MTEDYTYKTIENIEENIEFYNVRLFQLMCDCDSIRAILPDSEAIHLIEERLQEFRVHLCVGEKTIKELTLDLLKCRLWETKLRDKMLPKIREKMMEDKV